MGSDVPTNHTPPIGERTDLLIAVAASTWTNERQTIVSNAINMTIGNRMSRAQRLCGAVFSMISLLAVAGCADSGVMLLSPNQSPRELERGSAYLPTGEQQFRISPLDTLQVDVYPREMSDRNYRIDSGNQIEIVLSFRGESYRLAPGDTLSLDFSSDAVKSGNVLVRPDGAITLPRIGKDLHVAGMTADEARTAIIHEYGPVLQKSEITLTVVQSALDQLKTLSTDYSVGKNGTIVMPMLGSFRVAGETTAAVSTAIESAASRYFHNLIEADVSLAKVTNRVPDPQLSPSGLEYFHHSVNVSPDGNVFVPDAGTVKAAGKTLAELSADLTKDIQPAYENKIDARVSLLQSNNEDVFIGGDVAHPGRYPYSGTMTMLRLIANAGWIDSGGDLESVVLMHRDGKGDYLLYRSNVQVVFEGKADAYQDLRLTPGDMVIVPKTGIAEADQFVDQYIRSILPFNTSVNYTFVSQPTTLP